MAVHWLPEWAPQQCLLVTWPRADGDFAPHYADCCTNTAALVTAASAHQPVLVIAADDTLAADIRARLADLPAQRLRLVTLPNDDVWIRDYGPLSVTVDGALGLVDFRFDGWGGKYPADRDDQVSAALWDRGLLAAAAFVSSALVVEGGALETDGAGTLLATRRSVLDEARNPGLEQAAIEQTLRSELGVRRFHWLDHGGLLGDDTDGHIDTLARFAAPGHIVYQGSGGAADPNHQALAAMAAELATLRQADGQPYRLTALPAVAPVRDEDGRLLPASYANYCLINDAVLMPVYGVPNDEPARALLTELFPRRRVIAIDCRPLLRQNGSLHCATMNLMAPPISPT